jgi:hypothetical protein
MPQPIRYSDDVEQRIPNEDQVHQDLIDTMRSITETTSEDYGRAVRSVHAKAHGIFGGQLEIAGDLPPELAQGLFATPGTHKVVMRISTNPGDLLDDSVSAPRGLALKILDVAGERLPDSAGETSQNIILVNAPAFAAPDAKAFLGSLKQLAATTDKAEWAKKLLSAALRGVENVIEAAGGSNAMIATMGGTPITHPLGDTYYSQVPFRYGDYIAKFSLAPVSANLTDLTGDRVSAAGRPDALGEVIRETLVEQGGTWELRVQLNTDLDAMPVEDASVAWDEEASPYRTVGRIAVPRQLSADTDLAHEVDENSFFSPWHGLAAHRPLGSVNRTRRQAYEMSADFRSRFNGCPMHDSISTPVP